MLNGNQGSDHDGFTLIELMIVIAIIGILAAIAIPSFIVYRQKGYDASARSDINAAYTTAQAYFSDYPSSAVTYSPITAYGFRSTENVATTATGTTDSLQIFSQHTQGKMQFSTDNAGTTTGWSR